MTFHNRPNMTQNGEGKIKRYVHSPLTIDHYGINASILNNGQVVISKVAGPDKEHPGEVLVDEVQIPASLIFKLASLLKATRRIEYVSISEIKAGQDRE